MIQAEPAAGRSAMAGTDLPPVGVVLAAFGSPWMRAAIESVRAQTHSAWDLYVLDDANSPATRELVEAFQDPRLHYVANEVRLGPAMNHRKGIGLVSHELVACINHDDLWEPTLLAELVQALVDEPDAVVAFSDHAVIDENARVDEQRTVAWSRAWGRSGLTPGLHLPFPDIAVVQQSIPIAQCAVWRKPAISEIPAWTGDRYDYWIQVSLASTGRGAVYIPKRLARFRVHEANLGGSTALARRIHAVRFYTRIMSSIDLGPLRSHVAARRRRALFYALKWPFSLLRRPPRLSSARHPFSRLRAQSRA